MQTRSSCSEPAPQGTAVRTRSRQQVMGPHWQTWGNGVQIQEYYNRQAQGFTKMQDARWKSKMQSFLKLEGLLFLFQNQFTPLTWRIRLLPQITLTVDQQAVVLNCRSHSRGGIWHSPEHGEAALRSQDSRTTGRSSLQCTQCKKKKGHLDDTCWHLHGRPETPPASSSGSNSHAAHTAVAQSKLEQSTATSPNAANSIIANKDTNIILCSYTGVYDKVAWFLDYNISLGLGDSVERGCWSATVLTDRTDATDKIDTTYGTHRSSGCGSVGTTEPRVSGTTRHSK